MSNMWLEPKFHGDMVRRQCLIKVDQLGLIVIRQYAQALIVEAYLPGYIHHFPDGPKLQADKSRWVGTSVEKANILFDSYVELAFNDFWQVDYKAERNGQRNSTSGIDQAD